jgi:hypothetical protein
LVFARGLAGQVGGVVIDPEGRGVAEVTLTLWRAGQEIARVSSDSIGRFRFTVAQAERATALVARRLGLRPATTSVTPEATDLRLQMEPIPLPLPQMTVAATARACPNRESSEARQLWEAVRTRYAVPGLRDGLAMRLSWLRNEVPGSDVGEVDDSRLAEGEYTIAGIAREERARSLIERGYAVRGREETRNSYLEGEFFHWAYAPLWRDLIGHFVEDLFGRRHTLSAGRRADGSVLIAFCGVDRRRPHLEGTLEVSADSALTRASWRFVTPDPNEEAGAEVTFVPIAAHAPVAVLVPARSAFWRRIGNHGAWFYQDAAVYTSWAIAPYRTENWKR